MVDIPTSPDPMASQSMGPDEFNEAIQALFDFFQTWKSAVDQIGPELASMVDAKMYNGTITYNQTGYERPSFVYGSDGFTHVCVGENVVGDNPVGSVTGNWVAINFKNRVTPGRVHLLSVDDIPDWVLPLDGGAYDPLLYPKLYAKYGFKHGSDGGLFRVPKAAGLGVRALDAGDGVDPDAASRVRGDGTVGNNVGSVQEGATALPNTPFSTGDDTHGHALSGYGYGTAEAGSTLGVVKVGGSAVSTFNDTHNHQVTSGGDAESRFANMAFIFCVEHGEL